MGGYVNCVLTPTNNQFILFAVSLSSRAMKDSIPEVLISWVSDVLLHDNYKGTVFFFF